jgi:hypothetical protein
MSTSSMKGKLYRSERLERDQLEQVIRRFGIKSILNVRGEASGESWYENEISLSKNLHLTHFDYGLSASDPVTIEQINEIVHFLRDGSAYTHRSSLAPRPSYACTMPSLHSQEKHEFRARRHYG